DEYPKRCVEQLANWHKELEEYKNASRIDIKPSCRRTTFSGSCNTRRLITGIMAGRLWIRVSAIWRGGLSGYWRWPLSWRGSCCAQRVCRKALPSAMG
ncbi:hypothetical protein NE615_27800, partial [Escherichia coli]|nr:hypothetical protein [Escherichia coli]